MVLRVSRFFPEPDDRDEVRGTYDDLNLKVNELLYRRVDLEDVVTAHRLALEKAPGLGFGRYIISATTPFAQDDMAALAADAPGLVRQIYPDYEEVYARRGLENVTEPRPRIRQRPGAARPRMGAALRLPPCARLPPFRTGSA